MLWYAVGFFLILLHARTATGRVGPRTALSVKNNRQGQFAFCVYGNFDNCRRLLPRIVILMMVFDCRVSYIIRFGSRHRNPGSESKEESDAASFDGSVRLTETVWLSIFLSFRLSYILLQPETAAKGADFGLPLLRGKNRTDVLCGSFYFCLFHARGRTLPS